METIVAVAIAVIGWVTTHRLTLRANRKQFINTIVNSARLEVTAAVRDYQRWLGSVQVAVLAPPLLPLGSDIASLQRRMQVRAELNSRLFDDRSSSWSARLEEYQILFPYTANVRQELFSRDRRINERLHDVFQKYTSENRNSALEPTEEFRDLLGLIADQLGLLEDLRVHLQNRTLADLTGAQVPLRAPRDASCPRIVEMDGDLRIHSGDRIWPPPGWALGRGDS